MSISFGFVALSVHRALVGEIAPQFRAICLSVCDDGVTITVTHSGSLAEDVLADMDAAMAEVYADVPELGGDGIPLRLGFDRRDAPTPIPAIGVPIFAVKGTQFLVAAGV